MASLCVDRDARPSILVLGGTLFARSGQLRFLQYGCELEKAGKASELCEHLMGVEQGHLDCPARMLSKPDRPPIGRLECRARAQPFDVERLRSCQGFAWKELFIARPWLRSRSTSPLCRGISCLVIKCFSIAPRRIKLQCSQ
jgi:hypothetical protein